MVLTFSANEHGITVRQVRTLVESAFGVKISPSWVTRWLQKYPLLLTKRKTKYLPAKRANEDILDEVQSFINHVDKAKSKFGFVPHAVFNYDETRVCVGTHNNITIEWRGKGAMNKKGIKLSTLATLITFISAEGYVAMDIVILRGRSMPDTTDLLAEIPLQQTLQRYPTRSHQVWPRFFAVTESGYINQQLFNACIQKFIGIWQVQRPGLRAWLFGDQLGSHIDPTLTREALEQGVHMWLFPSNSSHFIQPLDSVPFAALKKRLSEEGNIAIFESVLTGHNVKEALFATFFEAVSTVFTQEVIQAGFERTGMYPWRPEKVMKNARANLAGERSIQVDTHVEKAIQAMTATLNNFEKSAKQRAGKVKLRTNRIAQGQLHDPQMLVAADDQARQTEARKRREAERKKLAAENVKRQRLDAKERLKCAEESCTKARLRGGKDWAVCPHCPFLLCKKHKRNMAAHQAEHRE